LTINIKKKGALEKYRYQVAFSASPGFIAGLIWATPGPLNGPTTLIKDSSSRASNIATDVCRPDKKVPVYEFHIRWILEVLPEPDHLVGIFRPESEPENKQHILSPHSHDFPGFPELRVRLCGGNTKTIKKGFRALITLLFDLIYFSHIPSSGSRTLR
jgi:hypothetical protein